MEGTTSARALDMPSTNVIRRRARQLRRSCYRPDAFEPASIRCAESDVGSARSCNVPDVSRTDHRDGRQNRLHFGDNRKRDLGGRLGAEVQTDWTIQPRQLLLRGNAIAGRKIRQQSAGSPPRPRTPRYRTALAAMLSTPQDLAVVVVHHNGQREPPSASASTAACGSAAISPSTVGNLVRVAWPGRGSTTIDPDPDRLGQCRDWHRSCPPRNREPWWRSMIQSRLQAPSAHFQVSGRGCSRPRNSWHSPPALRLRCPARRASFCGILPVVSPGSRLRPRRRAAARQNAIWASAQRRPEFNDTVAAEAKASSVPHHRRSSHNEMLRLSGLQYHMA